MAKRKYDEFFVNVSEPIILRRELLESSRLVIHLLQDCERQKELRKQKVTQLEKLAGVMKDIRSLVSKLKTELPDVPSKRPTMQLIEEEPKPVVIKPKKKKEEPKKIVVPKAASALDKLQAELDEVEKELSELE
jgi:hypothetical protein